MTDRESKTNLVLVDRIGHFRDVWHHHVDIPNKWSLYGKPVRWSASTAGGHVADGALRVGLGAILLKSTLIKYLDNCYNTTISTQFNSFAGVKIMGRREIETCAKSKVAFLLCY